MREGIKAIAFDIDGTLYPNWSFYWRIAPFLLLHWRFLVHFGRVRREIRAWQDEHPGEVHADFLSWQAELLSRRLRVSPAAARSLVDRLIYEGWRPVFARVRTFPGVHAAFAAFRAAGLPIGILSDFLPSQKGSIWGLDAMSDVILGSEETGALKPSPVPFLALASALGAAPGEILYVGNSVASDVVGGAAAGMRTACVISPLRAFLWRLTGARAFATGADISFTSYRKLVRDVLK